MKCHRVNHKIPASVIYSALIYATLPFFLCNFHWFSVLQGLKSIGSMRAPLPGMAPFAKKVGLS